nr:integrase, catalytic region, zinc finger, CCHC-type, peptidase aspartic, catalytic [Tanacetum cinerariifolium]
MMANLSKDIQCAGSDTRPPMLDRSDFKSWRQLICLYFLGKDNWENILKSIDEGPFKMGKFRETLAEGTEGALYLGPERDRVFADLTPKEKERFKSDIHATNILLQGLPIYIYKLINHYTDVKDIWDNVKMLLEGYELTKDEPESQLYDEFEHFCQHKGETIHEYYIRFTKLINDMQNIKMTMPKFQLNSKFMNNMLPEWGRFLTVVKLNRGLKTSNYDQLYAYLKQHEAHANKNKMMLETNNQHAIDPLAFVANASLQQYPTQSSATLQSAYISPVDRSDSISDELVIAEMAKIVMANPNPEEPNIPNEDVPEEDPYQLLDFDEEEDPKMDIEEEEPEEDPVEEPEPLARHGDQFDAHHNPQPGNMNGWVDDHDDVEEDDENEDVDIKEDDDAEIIFPYEVQGDQTPLPGDESSAFKFDAEEADNEFEVEEASVEPKAEGADVELEAEEPDGAPEATIGIGSQRRDLEALHRQERIREAESGTSRTEISLLGSEARIGKIEREILHHDLSGVEETLEKVVERLKVLESEDNVTLKKKFAEKEMLLDLTRIDRDRAERRLSESI